MNAWHLQPMPQRTSRGKLSVRARHLGFESIDTGEWYRGGGRT